MKQLPYPVWPCEVSAAAAVPVPSTSVPLVSLSPPNKSFKPVIPAPIILLPITPGIPLNAKEARFPSGPIPVIPDKSENELIPALLVTLPSVKSLLSSFSPPPP